MEIEIYIAIFPIFLFLFNNLFLEISIMLNIAKWIYFFFVIKTHRSIREHEIEVEMTKDEKDSKKVVSGIVGSTETTTVDEKLLNDSKEKSNGIKQQHLKKLKN